MIKFMMNLFISLALAGGTVPPEIQLVTEVTPTTQVLSAENLEIDSAAVEGGLEHKNLEEIQAALNKKVSDGMINISMNINPIFENGESEGNLMIVNEDINKYPQVVEIYRDDTNELVYKSGGIPVGSRVDESTLTVDLAKGTYDCTAYFNAVNPDTSELVGKAGAKIKITVIN